MIVYLALKGTLSDRLYVQERGGPAAPTTSYCTKAT